MPLKQEERQAAYDKWSPVLGEIFDDLDKDKSGFASVDEMWYVLWPSGNNVSIHSFNY